MLKRSNMYNDLRVTRRDNFLDDEFLVGEPTPRPACEVDFKFPTARSEMASLSSPNEPHAQHLHSSLPYSALLRLNSIGQRHATAPRSPSSVWLQIVFPFH